MERTKRFFLPDDTSKPLIRQGFSESYFRNDTSFSSQPRYDHFDTAAYSIFRVRHRKNVISSQPRYDLFDTAAYLFPAHRLPT